MTHEEIYQEVIDILTDINPDVEWTGFGPEDSLKGTLDSMDFMDVVMSLRKRHQVEVPEADYGHLATLKGCVDYLEPLLKDK